MISIFTLFVTSFVLVALKSFQQQNVTHDKKWLVPPTSYLLALLEVSMWLSVVKECAFWPAIPIGTGSWLGCFFAMEVHKRIRRDV